MKKLDDLFFALIIGLILTAPAMAVQHVEDFEYATPDSNSFTNGVFQHNLVPKPGVSYVAWEISDFGPPPSGNALDLWPAIDEITFDLDPGEYVDYVAVDCADFAPGSTIFEVIGTLDTYSVLIVSGFWNDWGSVDTTGQNLGEITMVKLSSNEGAFDNLTINVVPEPATVLLFGLCGLALRRKRKINRA